MDEKKFFTVVLMNGILFGMFYALWFYVIAPLFALPTLSTIQAVAIFLMLRTMFYVAEVK
jgi:prepilin signal peptidase PulO-like enzyme (type II secretory pathway)